MAKGAKGGKLNRVPIVEFCGHRPASLMPQARLQMKAKQGLRSLANSACLLSVSYVDADIAEDQ